MHRSSYVASWRNQLVHKWENPSLSQLYSVDTKFPFTKTTTLNRMAMFAFCCFLILVCLDSLAGDGDPSSWPGHLEPLASKAKILQVEALDYFPSPQEFFMNYAYRGVPVIFRGGAKEFPAYSKWSDLYLRSIPEAQWTMVGVEINKKEDRTLPTQTMPLQEFIQRYQSHNEYLVTSVPAFLRYDVLVPPPLRCTQVINNLVDCLLWISGGGTKSVLHNDNVDNINCIFSGRKEFLLLNYTKYKDDIIFDRIEEGAMSVDVEKVDFTKFPTLAKVDFHFASVSAGDCIFLPYKWIHQVNSFDRNIAVNIWWDHKARIVPTKRQCGYIGKRTNLADVYFHRQARNIGENSKIPHQVADGRDPLSDLVSLMEQFEVKNLSLEEFTTIALEGVLQWSHLTRTKEVDEEIRKIYNLLDENGDQVLSYPDLIAFRSEENSKLHRLAQNYTDVLMDLLDEQLGKEKQEQLRELQGSIQSEEKIHERVVEDGERFESKISSEDLDERNLQDSVDARVTSRVKEEL